MSKKEIIKHAVFFFLLALALITLGAVNYSDEIHKASYTMNNLKAYERLTLNINDPVISFIKVELVSGKDQHQAEISVEKVSVAPKAIDNLYQALYVRSSIKDIDIISIEIIYRVPKSFLSANNYDKSLTSLYRLYNDKWIRISSYLINEDQEYNYYKASSSGLSYFAITGEKSPVVTTSPAGSSPVIEKPAKETHVQEKSRTNTSLIIFLLAGFGFVIIILIIILFVALRKPKIEENTRNEEIMPSRFLSLRSGLVISNIHELKKALKYMDDSDFIYHKNNKDIEEWVEKGINRPEIASIIRNSKTKEELIKALEGVD